MKRTTFSNARGFSTIQMVITLAVVTIVTGFAVVSISRARDHFRLMNSARQFAGYVERARADSIRRHVGPANAATVLVTDDNTYSVTMDWDGSGNTRTQNFDLEQAIVFTPGMVGRSVTFDWRGRIPVEQSFGFDNGRNQVNVHVTGSGDVTFDSEWFFDASLPAVVLNGGDPAVMPEPSPGPGYGSPTPSPSPGSSPSPGHGPSPTPTGNPSPTPTGNPSPTPTATATPDDTASPTPSDTATPTPVPCTLTANPDPLTIVSQSAGTISVNRNNATGAGTITATSSNNGQIQVSPTSASVSGTGAATFTVTVKNHSGSVTFAASGCGSKTVSVTIQ